MGTLAWRNWRAWAEGEPRTEGWESALYSDVQFERDLEVGPYKFIPTFPSWDRGLALAVVLRADFHLHGDGFSPDMTRTDASRYHGGTIPDELAALAGLALGARLRSGGDTRAWFRDGEDPLGRPVEFDHRRPYLPEPARGWPVLPRLTGSRSLSDAAELLNKFPELDDRKAVALVRAARMHGRAAWVADDDPNLAWIYLVGALEAAAGQYKPVKRTKLERVQNAEPALAELLLTEGGPELAEKAAEHLVVGLRAKDRFLAFLETYLPEPPPDRPEGAARVDWDAMGQHALTIYDYRSRALHAGLPFPAPMCEHARGEDESGPSETPPGLSTWALDGSWLAADAPMLLSTFEYVARGALCRWWADG